LKQALPQLNRLAVMLDPDEVDLASFANLIGAPARSLGIELQILEVRRQDDFERAFRLAREGRAQAIFTVETTFVVENRSLVAEFAARERLPLAGEFTAFGSEGLLMAYGADLSDLLRRAATHVDRVLKGARPGELPIEQPTKFPLLVNLKTAKTLGVTIPQSLLLLADEIIR
jgi:putative ABC transport system substrate-binding protein